VVSVPTPTRPAAGEVAVPGGDQNADGRSRRQLFAKGGGALVGAAALLAGCSDKTRPPSNIPLNKSTPGSKRDVEILNGLLAIEYRAIAAYTALVPALPQPANIPKPTTPGPPPPPNPNQPLILRVPLAIAAVRDFLGLETSHAGELQGIVTQAGGTPVKPEASYALPHDHGKLAIIRFLHGLEQEELAAYLHAVTSLPAGRLRGAVAAILANEAQQISALRMVLGMAPAPSALVTAQG
jgi:hypothetical protein